MQHSSNIKISKIVKDLNISISDITEFLHSKNIYVDINPNTRIDENTADILKQHFSHDLNANREIERSITHHQGSKPQMKPTLTKEITKNRYNAFISFSSKDSFPIEACNFLEENGIKCWIAPRNIPPGTPYARAIMKGINESEIILVFISSNSLRSEDVLNEVDNAHGLKKKIIPVFIDNIELSAEFKYYLTRRQWISWSEHIMSDILSVFSYIQPTKKVFSCTKIEPLYTISYPLELRNIFSKTVDSRSLFADIIIGFSPVINNNEPLTFTSLVPNNNIPQEYISAVKRGLENVIQSVRSKGLTTFGIHATLYDGSYHTINSNNKSFECVAEDALYKALSKEGLRLLEPMMRIEIERDYDDETDINNFINKYNGEIFNILHRNNKYEAHALIPNNKILEHGNEIVHGNISINYCEFAKYDKGITQQFNP